jgi:hypothetical protein
MGRTQNGEKRAKEEKGKVSESRANEISRREEAQAHAGGIVAGSGRRGKPRRMARMVSARLDGELVSKLQVVAQQRNTTVSDLLRVGAELIVKDAYADAVAWRVTKSEGVVGSRIQSGQGNSANVPNQGPPSSGSITTTTRPKVQLAGT